MKIEFGFADIKIYTADQKFQPYELVAEYKNYKDALNFKGNYLKKYIYFVDGNYVDYKNFIERATLFINDTP